LTSTGEDVNASNHSVSYRAADLSEESLKITKTSRVAQLRNAGNRRGHAIYSFNATCQLNSDVAVRNIR